MVLAAVRQGLCVGVMLRTMVEDLLKSGELINLFPDRSVPGKKLYLAYAKQGVLPKKLLLFKQFIKENWK